MNGALAGLGAVSDRIAALDGRWIAVALVFHLGNLGFRSRGGGKIAGQQLGPAFHLEAARLSQGRHLRPNQSGVAPLSLEEVPLEIGGNLDVHGR